MVEGRVRTASVTVLSQSGRVTSGRANGQHACNDGRLDAYWETPEWSENE
jgi:hypothetical protein